MKRSNRPLASPMLLRPYLLSTGFCARYLIRTNFALTDNCLCLVVADDPVRQLPFRVDRVVHPYHLSTGFCARYLITKKMGVFSYTLRFFIIPQSFLPCQPQQFQARLLETLIVLPAPEYLSYQVIVFRNHQ